jgi:hypothetical protein
MYDFPSSAMTFTNTVNKGSSFAPSLSTDTATKIVNYPLVDHLLKTSLGDRYNDKKKGTLIKVLTSDTKSPLFYVRSALIFSLMSFNTNLPHFISSAFAIPLSTTYSFGHGLIYGLISGPNTSYPDFMSRALVLTLILFHLCVIFVFFTLRKLGARPLSSALGSLLLLFSISMYSYGYHLGSTVWNYTTSAAFLWFVINYYSIWESRKYLKRTAWLAGILVFFNYLIVFYWAAFLLSYFLLHRKDIQGDTNFKKILAFSKSQYPALILIFLCAFLLYPPGQAAKGGMNSIGDLFSFTYYIVLNIFSWYNKSAIVDSIQFGLATSLCALGLFLRSNRVPKKENDLFFTMIKVFFGILLISMILGLLYYGPSRHLLFAAPFLFILVGLGLDAIFTSFPVGSRTGIALILLTAMAGFACTRARINDTIDSTLKIVVDPNVEQVMVNGCSFHLAYKDWGKNRTVAKTTPTYIKGNTYLSVGEEGRLPISVTEDGFKTEIVHVQDVQSGIYFTAYNPEHYPWDRQNGFTAFTFKVLEVPKKH